MRTERDLAGHCLCGKIKIQISGKLQWSAYCHCAECRRQCASVVAAYIAVELEDFKVIEGEMRIFKSSPGVKRSFCSDCGTPISYESELFPNSIHVHIGVLDENETVEPKAHLFTAEKIVWFNTTDDYRRFESVPKI